MNQELQDQELKLNNIEVYERDLKTVEALTVLVDKNYYIGIKKGYNKEFNYWLIEHELEHIKNKTFYNTSSSEYVINKNERITNDAVILKNGLASSVQELLDKGLSKQEICMQLKIPDELYELTVQLIKRKTLTLVSEYLKKL